jgi:hypothetical protein
MSWFMLPTAIASSKAARKTAQAGFRSWAGLRQKLRLDEPKQLSAGGRLTEKERHADSLPVSVDHDQQAEGGKIL